MVARVRLKTIPETHERRPQGPRFKKGNVANRRGRVAGTPNKTTRVLKEAIILAAETVGEDKKGKNGLHGYLRMVAKTDVKSFCALLGRVLPMTLNANLDVKDERVYKGVQELRAALLERGLDVPAIYERPMKLVGESKAESDAR